MLSASSPIAFPSDPISPIKRSQPHDVQFPKSKPKTGPFLDDSESEDETSVRDAEPAAKRRRVGEVLENNGSPEVILRKPSPIIVDEEENDAEEGASPGKGTSQRTRDVSSTATFIRPREFFSSLLLGSSTRTTYRVKACDGSQVTIKERKEAVARSYESMVAARSKTREGRAKRDYYGVDIHNLLNTAQREIAQRVSNTTSSTSNQASARSNVHVPMRSPAAPQRPAGKASRKGMLWTEKYRARTFMDLCGDDSTNRLVLRWLKRWDPLVFPGQAKSRPSIAGRQQPEEHEKAHRKILMLTGPPGLGKTTLAHVCAKQAGYEVIEVNASDDRSRDIVKGRIRTILGTESVKSVGNLKDGATGSGHSKLAKPACVVVDEVDGVTSGAGAAGEGGFIKALIDLVMADQKNSSSAGGFGDGDLESGGKRKKKKGDDFRQMRPLILICNDVYHPSLRPLRQSNLAEIIHVGRPMLDAVVGRLRSVFEKEGIPCDKDAARKLCEAAWGMASGFDAKRGQESTVHGDLRGVMVVGEWVASRFRAESTQTQTQTQTQTHDSRPRLTREWIERNILSELASGAAGARGLGRGSVRDIVSRIFQEGGGFPKQALDLSTSTSKLPHEQPKTELGLGEHHRRHAMECLAQMVDASGEISHIVTEVFAEYPAREFNDDHYLTKPDQAYDWLWFHDSCQSRLFASQEWELAPYLGQPVLACHHLFASPHKHHHPYTRPGGVDDNMDGPPVPFSGPRADYQAHEAEKHTRAQLQSLQAQLAPSMMRLFRSPEAMATDFLPYLTRLVSPDVKPVVVGGTSGGFSTASVRKESERVMVRRAAEVLADVGITLQRGKIESDDGGLHNNSRAPQYVYRMEPDLDALSAFETSSSPLSSQAPTRYAVRQVLDQELQRTIALRETLARQARFKAGHSPGDSSSTHAPLVLLDDAQKRRKLRNVVAESSSSASVKRDFFGRVIVSKPAADADADADADGREGKAAQEAGKEERKVWVTYHEGLNNAVRKPMTLSEFLQGLY